MKHWKFYAMLRRYLQGSLPEADVKRFDRFVDETTLSDAETSWSEGEQLALLKRINEKIDNPMPVKKRMSNSRFVQLAVLVTVLVTGSYYAFQWIAIRNQGAGEQKTFLSDGTIVWLKTGDKLSYYETADGVRHATLSGEALFEVAKDPSRPFILQCGLTAIRVTGTSFTLRVLHDSVTLTVLTGNVAMTSIDDTTGISVLPNEKVVYSGHGLITKQLQQANDVPAYVRTTEYNMRFTDATVEVLAERIEKKFDVKVTLKDARLKDCHVTADFTDHSLEKTLTMLTEVLDITYTVTGAEVTLHGTGCQ